MVRGQERGGMEEERGRERGWRRRRRWRRVCLRVENLSFRVGPQEGADAETLGTLRGLRRWLGRLRVRNLGAWGQGETLRWGTVGRGFRRTQSTSGRAAVLVIVVFLNLHIFFLLVRLFFSSAASASVFRPRPLGSPPPLRLLRRCTQPLLFLLASFILLHQPAYPELDV
jgi:hypothetical protein